MTHSPRRRSWVRWPGRSPTPATLPWKGRVTSRTSKLQRSLTRLSRTSSTKPKSTRDVNVVCRGFLRRLHSGKLTFRGQNLTHLGPALRPARGSRAVGFFEGVHRGARAGRGGGLGRPHPAVHDLRVHKGPRLPG